MKPSKQNGKTQKKENNKRQKNQKINLCQNNHLW